MNNPKTPSHPKAKCVCLMLSAMLLLFFSTAAGCGRPSPRLPAKDIFTDPQQQKFVQAIIDGNDKRVQDMVAEGMDVNIRGKYNLTPLYYAIHYQRKEIYGLLLQKGADPWLKWDTSGPKVRNRYGLLGFTVAATAANDSDPDYLLEMLKYDQLSHGDQLLSAFFSWPTGVYRNQSLRGKEAQRVDMIKLQAIFDAGITLPADAKRQGMCLGHGILHNRYCCALMLLHKGVPLSLHDLRYIEQDRERYLGSDTWPAEARETFVGLDELCAYLESLDADIFTKMKNIAVEERKAQETNIDTDKPKSQERIVAMLQQLTDELNAKRQITHSAEHQDAAVASPSAESGSTAQ